MFDTTKRVNTSADLKSIFNVSIKEALTGAIRKPMIVTQDFRIILVTLIDNKQDDGLPDNGSLFEFKPTSPEYKEKYSREFFEQEDVEAFAEAFMKDVNNK